MPYTHPMPIKSFVVTTGPDGNMYVVTAGGEGLIRTWTLTNGQFTYMSVLEGHIRGVTSLLLLGSVSLHPQVILILCR